MNEPLAKYYGMSDVFGGHFRRVTSTDERRRGLLGHASVLTVTSYADRTSPVLRGIWMLEDVDRRATTAAAAQRPPLPKNDEKAKPTSLRERLELHRSNPVCASCHANMDPLGFALEHFDAIGRWRETDDGAAINSTIATAQGERDRQPGRVSRAPHDDHGPGGRADGHRAALHVRAGTRRDGTTRTRPRFAGSSRGGGSRLPLVVARPGDCEERSVPDAASAGPGRRDAARDAVAER